MEQKESGTSGKFNTAILPLMLSVASDQLHRYDHIKCPVPVINPNLNFITGTDESQFQKPIEFTMIPHSDDVLKGPWTFDQPGKRKELTPKERETRKSRRKMAKVSRKQNRQHRKK